MQDLIAKAETLLEALPYIQKFNGATFVVKYGGSFMDSPDEKIRTSVARDIVFLEAVEINPVIVHGGGKAITRAMEKAGLKANFIQGQRVTDEATVKIVDDVLSGEINPEIVKTIKGLGGRPVGFAGRDIFKCKKLFLDDKENPGRKIDIGYVGEVIEVNVQPLKESMWCGFTPVISPTARGEDGKIYNCNADIAAAMCAIALNAKRLVFMSDVPGLMRDPEGPFNGHRPFANPRGSRAQSRRGRGQGDDSEGGQRHGRHRIRRGKGLLRGRPRAARRHARNLHRQGCRHGSRALTFTIDDL